VAFFLDMVALAGGLLLGGLGGYALGTRWRDDHRILWPVAITAFLAASILNFVGRVMGLEWLSIGSIGLMAGVTSGIKYGGFPDVRVWEKRPPRPRDESADGDKSTSEDAEAALSVDNGDAPSVEAEGASSEPAQDDCPEVATEQPVVQVEE
jgi:hypothetical protein